MIIVLKDAAKLGSAPGALRIRPAVQNDVEALTRLINAAFVVERIAFEGNRINSEKVRSYIVNGCFLLAEDSSGPAGCVYAEIRNDRGYVGLLSVDPPRQGAGLGRKLMDAAEDYFREAGCYGVDLRVISARTALPPFYRHLGYSETGTAPFHAEVQTKIPCHYILMSKSLK